MHRHLIVGGLGQDGCLLTDLLTSFGHPVLCTTQRKDGIKHNSQAGLEIIVSPSVDNYLRVINQFMPDVIYNFASLSSVFNCEKNPQESLNSNYHFPKLLFMAVEKYLLLNPLKQVQFVQAGSSEMFGGSKEPVTEISTRALQSIYGKHKNLAHDFLESKKEISQNLRISNLFLFNHESIFRGENFISQKIAKAAANILLLGDSQTQFGNVKAARDWGCAREYVRAIAMLGTKFTNENYVVSSGKSHTIEELLNYAFDYVGKSKQELIVQDRSLFRQNDSSVTVGNSQKIFTEVGWKAQRTIFEVIEEMVDNQIILAQNRQ